MIRPPGRRMACPLLFGPIACRSLPQSAAASRLHEKPLNLVPHGGGAQLVAGSAEAQIIAQWADLIAGAQCN